MPIAENVSRRTQVQKKKKNKRAILQILSARYPITEMSIIRKLAFQSDERKQKKKKERKRTSERSSIIDHRTEVNGVASGAS